MPVPPVTYYGSPFFGENAPVGAPESAMSCPTTTELEGGRRETHVLYFEASPLWEKITRPLHLNPTHISFGRLQLLIHSWSVALSRIDSRWKKSAHLRGTTVMEKGGKRRDRKPHPVPHGLRIHTETSSPRTLKIMPRNLKEFVRLWIWLRGRSLALGMRGWLHPENAEPGPAVQQASVLVIEWCRTLMSYAATGADSVSDLCWSRHRSGLGTGHSNSPQWGSGSFISKRIRIRIQEPKNVDPGSGSDTKGMPFKMRRESRLFRSVMKNWIGSHF